MVPPLCWIGQIIQVVRRINNMIKICRMVSINLYHKIRQAINDYNRLLCPWKGILRPETKVNVGSRLTNHLQSIFSPAHR